MKNKTKDVLGIAFLVLGFVVFILNPVRFTGMSVGEGGATSASNPLISIAGFLGMAVGVAFLIHSSKARH